MKCLAVGKDNIVPNTDYNSATVGVTGFQNLKERIAATGTSGGFSRMWFVPNEMTLKRHVDEETGQATIIFDKANIALRTEAYIAGQTQPPVAKDFADHFMQYYDEFAGVEFPVYNPYPADPQNPDIITVKIFDMLRDAMKAVSLARFFSDNDIPLDMWWLNSWDKPYAYSPKSVPTAFFEEQSGGNFFLVYGGIEILKPNDYVPSTIAQTVGQSIISSRPDQASDPNSDIDEQMWTPTIDLGQGNETLTAVSSSVDADFQDGDIRLSEVDLSFASPGSQPLQFVRYYQSSYLGQRHLGPGWRDTRYVLEFQRPSWFDENGLMRDSNGNELSTESQGDTRLRSGIVRLVDLASGGALHFESSLNLDYSLDSWGNPVIQVSGLNATNTPDYTPLLAQNGSTLQQVTSDGSYDYLIQTPDGAQLLFDSEGRLLKTTDRHDYSHNYAYDTVGCLQSITDDVSPVPQVISFFYDTDLHLDYITGPANERVDYDYHLSGCLKEAKHQRSGAAVTYTYNTDKQLQDKTFFNGFKAFTTTPDLRGRAESADDIRGNTLNHAFSLEIGTNNHVTETIDPNSSFGSWQRIFDQEGRLLSTENPFDATTSFEYTGDSLLPNLISRPIPNRPAISITRNIYGQPKVIDDPANIGASPVLVNYTATNKLDDFTDPAGRLTDMQYNLDDDLEWIKRYLGAQEAKTSFGYENGYLKTITDPLNNPTTYLRDNLGRIEFLIDATNVQVQYIYDTFGRLWKVVDPRLSSAIEYLYDNFDRIKTITSPDGTITYDYYPATGLLWKITDVRARVTTFEYYPNTTDVSKITRVVTGGDDIVTEFTYDRFGNIEQVTPPDSQPITFAYDDLGRLQSSTEADSLIPGAPKALDSNNADNGVWTNQPNHTFTWGAPDTDVGVAGYSYSSNATPDEVQDTVLATATWNSVLDGIHTFQVKAQSNSSIWGNIGIFNLMVDTQNPTLATASITPPDLNIYTAGSATVSITADDNAGGSGIADNGVQIRWCFSNDASRPWTAYAVTSKDASNQWTAQIAASWMAEAGKTLYYQIKVSDIAGNSIESSEYSELINRPQKPILIYTK